jgi:hypothetical protein
MSFNPPRQTSWAPASGEILSVSDLIGYARNLVESGLSDVWVEG